MKIKSRNKLNDECVLRLKLILGKTMPDISIVYLNIFMNRQDIVEGDILEMTFQISWKYAYIFVQILIIYNTFL